MLDTNTQIGEMFRRQYAAGARGLESMLAKAVKTGKKVGGYTVEELTAHVAEYRRPPRSAR